MRGFLVTIGLFAAAIAAKSSNCADGLYMIVARGSGEPAAASPKGLFPKNSASAGYLAQLIAAQINGSEIMGVEYPATEDNPPYQQSESDGATAMLQLVNEYHSSCPDSKMALLGYSQGAQVVSDVVCGGLGGIFNHDAPLSPELVKNSIVAIVLWGDPTHIANTTYDRGTSVHDGIFPRKNNTVCKQYSDRMASWCDKGDQYCDAGKNEAVHGNYLPKYNRTMVHYVVERWQNSTVSSTTATSTGSTTSSATSRPFTGAASGLTAGQSLYLGWLLMLLSCGLFFG